jgi:prepilin-type N-terminal cleavage/methylation domain-containing protein
MSGSRPDRGMSLVEVLLTLVIISLALVPIIQVFSQSHRIGHSARRLVEVTMHAQSLLEALAELDDTELPVPQGTEVIVLSDAGGGGFQGTGRYTEVEELFKRRPLPVEGMTRTIVAKKLATKELELRIDVEWDSVVGEKKTRQKLSLPMLSTPRNWQ